MNHGHKKVYTPKTAQSWAKRHGWTKESAVTGGWAGLAKRLNAEELEAKINPA
jgi:uncharacterized protein YjcR